MTRKLRDLPGVPVTLTVPELVVIRDALDVLDPDDLDTRDELLQLRRLFDTLTRAAVPK